MEAMHSPTVIWLLASIQVFGFAAVILARLSERSLLQSWCQLLFFMSLVLVGVATVASLALDPAVTLASGCTLAVMAVAAVWELRPAVNVETF
jgi:hypothetical protein